MEETNEKTVKRPPFHQEAKIKTIQLLNKNLDLIPSTKTYEKQNINENIQWTLSLSRLPSISNISLSRRKLHLSPRTLHTFLYFKFLYLELFPMSNKFSGPLNHFLSLSRTFTYSNFISTSRINTNLNQNKSFDRE